MPFNERKKSLAHFNPESDGDRQGLAIALPVTAPRLQGCRHRRWVTVSSRSQDTEQPVGAPLLARACTGRWRGNADHSAVLITDPVWLFQLQCSTPLHGPESKVFFTSGLQIHSHTMLTTPKASMFEPPSEVYTLVTSRYLSHTDIFMYPSKFFCLSGRNQRGLCLGKSSD